MLLRYAGSQRKVADLITRNEYKKYLPEFSEYREPFLGGGSVYLAVKERCHIKNFWVNDLDHNLINFWIICRDDNSKLIDQIMRWKKEYIGTEDDYKCDVTGRNGRELFSFLHHNMYKFDLIERASAYYLLNRMAFSGMTLSAGFSNSAYASGLKDNVIREIAEYKNILQETNITNLDYEEVVNKEGENVFIFCGPPYYNVTANRLYGINGDLHKSFDFYRFAKVMKSIGDKHKWLITLDDSNTIRKLFSWARIEEIEVYYVMKKAVGKELLISNYEFIKTQNDIEDAWGIDEGDED